MKKIVYITGTRAEYGVVKGLLRKLQGAFDVSLIVTGMHLSDEHGHTVDEIRKDGFRIVAEIDNRRGDNSLAGMAKSVGHEIVGIADVLAQEKPDLVMVAGDRGEALAGAVAAAHLNIPITHVSGGDTTTGATIDEKIRHAITQFSDVHFPASKRSARMIARMGKGKGRVFPVGNPGVKTVYRLGEAEKAAIATKYEIDRNRPLLLVVQHPVTSKPHEAGKQMGETFKALAELKLPTVLIYPNSDAGSVEAIAAIKAHEREPYLHIYKHVPREDFLVLMGIADAIVGNSSAALIEAPSFGLPAVNIGQRQEGRERTGNVIDVPHEKQAIVEAIKKALSKQFRTSLEGLENPYAKENADEQILEILKKYA